MYHSFLIHPSADEHLGCFHVLDIINSVQVDSLLSEPPGKPSKDMVHSQTNKQKNRAMLQEGNTPSSLHLLATALSPSLLSQACKCIVHILCPFTPIFDGLCNAQSSFQGRAYFPNYWECCREIAFCYWPFRIVSAGERADSPQFTSILVCPCSMNDWRQVYRLGHLFPTWGCTASVGALQLPTVFSETVVESILYPDSSLSSFLLPFSRGLDCKDDP